MRTLIASAAALLVTLGSASATQPSWPITSEVEFSAPSSAAARGGTAVVHVAVSEAATDIDVQVYGLDGMRVGHRNIARLHRDRLNAGASVSFPVAIHPGSGRSLVVVSARAHFAHLGDGSTVRSFPYGEEDAAQQAEHTRCVRRDPEGVWIRDPDCAAQPYVPPLSQSTPPSAVAPGVPAAQPLDPTISQLKTSPRIGQIVRVVGYVIGSYFCPPCPEGAECKPCSTESAIFVADAPTRDLSSPANFVTIAAPNPALFEHGVQYRFEIEVVDHRDGAVDARLLRSQRPDREPVWPNGRSP